jgi:ABC-2 type transport system permease protein
MGVGMLLRDQVAALGVLIPFFFLVTPVLELIPVLRTAAQFLPDEPGRSPSGCTAAPSTSSAR